MDSHQFVSQRELLSEWSMPIISLVCSSFLGQHPDIFIARTH